MATYSSICAWKIPRTKEPGGLQSWGSTESDPTERAHTHGEYTHTHTRKHILRDSTTHRVITLLISVY